MKLNQLGLTPAGMKATKKLGSQVHKATVAAAMEPKLRLGVVGIEIGQEQSTGPTSITEEIGDSVIVPMIKAANALQFPIELPAATELDAWNLALELGKLCNGVDKSKAEWAIQLLDSLRLATRPNINTKLAKELLEHGITAGPVGKAISGISAIADFGVDIPEQLLSAKRIFKFIVFLIATATGEREADALDRKMAIAVCRRAGFKV